MWDAINQRPVSLPHFPYLLLFFCLIIKHIGHQSYRHTDVVCYIL
jgi:hypothetical protein